MSSASFTINIQETIVGNAALQSVTAVSGTTTGAASDAEVVANAINAVGLTNVSATVDAQNRVVISHSKGGEIRFKDHTERHLQKWALVLM